MRYKYKYITVKLSRSSSLAVINSAAVGSWMLWQFLLAWLWKSEPTCPGLVQAILGAQTCWPQTRFIGSTFFGQIGFWHSALIPYFYGWHCCTSPIAGGALDGWWGAAWYLSLARSRSTEWAANRQGLVWGGNTGCDNEHNDRWLRVSMLKWNAHVVKWSGCVASTLSHSLGVWDFAWGSVQGALDTCPTPLRPLVKQQPHSDQDPPVVLIGHWMSRD